VSRPDYNGGMHSDHVIVERDGPVVRIIMNRPERRNALSQQHLEELLAAFVSVGGTDALGVVLAGNGPVFSAGHDFGDLAAADLDAVRRMLWTCTELMQTMQSIPQVVVASVHGLATAAGCQLVATADLAVAAESAAFAAPGGKGGWFCTTPMVAIGRTVSTKHALELALTGDAIDAATAAAWGLVNRVVPDGELEAATLELLGRATRGGRESKALGKRAFYEQIGLPQPEAYAVAVEVMARASQIPDAREGMRAFLDKRPPKF
jgi:enoyl-CoA hydratase/carnithine racemase